MKYLFLTLLLSGFAFAETDVETSENIEVGSPKDCVALGKADDQQKEENRHLLQQKIMNCLGPQEDEKAESRDPKTAEVVSQ